MRQLVPSNPFGDVSFGNPYPLYSKASYMQSLFDSVSGARLQRPLIFPSLWNGRKMCARRIRPPKGLHKLVRDAGMLLILNVDRLMVLSAMFNCMGNIDGIDLSDRK